MKLNCQQVPTPQPAVSASVSVDSVVPSNRKLSFTLSPSKSVNYSLEPLGISDQLPARRISLLDHLLEGFADQRHILLECLGKVRRGSEIPTMRDLLEVSGSSQGV